MSPEKAALLGAIAGATIFLGLPIGRVGGVSQRARSVLSMLAAGVLLFIFWDVMDAAHAILATGIDQARAGGGWSTFALRAATATLGFCAGAVGLIKVERMMMRRRPLPPIAGAAGEIALPAVPSAADLAHQARRASLTLGMLIATAIGLHNFSEGLAIGVSARAGEIGLATTLIVGFALHNATEGFGIVGPLGGVRPSWGWLAAAGLVGGGPTFLGTLVGYRVTSPALEICFYTLAAGAILYVLGQLWTSAARRLSTELILTGVAAGFLLGMASDLVITYAGG